ncbi:alpha/beta hydrolase [Thermoflavimicrobium dichotomicum]|uniref:Alpha/beta hydrolase fold n=1 Tax=Thermoflavimicrobium dichotomicum TaxID=46223 RepID=A0A1I3RJB8_9BACL|nr:alpha/beta fold hydrolase [Thermoflavimicrobium dichotomicum]SFJ46375.1 alpha/beta hydrolase fold [Thermoflavimicrobium dichotomicum]
MYKQSFTLDVGKEDRVIRGEVRIPKSAIPSPTIIFCHGFKAFKDWGFIPILATKLAEAGFAVITFNFSMNGVGENSETYTELDKFAHLTFSREQEDIALILEHIHSRTLPYGDQLDKKNIGILGHSRGGGNSIIFALEHPDIKSVAVWNSIHRPDFFGEDIIRELKEKGKSAILNARTGQWMPIDREVLDDIEQNAERYHFMKRLPDLDRPLLLVQADQDHPGFLEGAQEMAKRAPKAKLKVIANANHTFGAVHPFSEMTPQLREAITETIHFFNETLKD